MDVPQGDHSRAVADRFYEDHEVAALLERAADPARTWSELVSAGTPLADPGSRRMTFLFESHEPVHLWINRLTDKEGHRHGVMLQAEGLPYWAKTVTVPPDLMASYCFRRATGPHLADPHARGGRLVGEIGSPLGTSLLLGARAHVGVAWECLTETAASVGTGVIGPHELEGYFYAPAGAKGELPLVILFDADVWFDQMHLASALERAISTGLLPACAVVGVGFRSTEQRRSILDPGRNLVDEVLHPLRAWAGERLEERHCVAAPSGEILAGQSLGGLVALVIGAQQPERFRALIATSPSLWWTPAHDASPNDLAAQIQPWLVEEVIETLDDGEQLPQAYLSVGLREGHSVAHVLSLSREMHSIGWRNSVRLIDGGHDLAWWREELVASLADALSRF